MGVERHRPLVCIGPMSKPLGGESLAFASTVTAAASSELAPIVTVDRGSAAGNNGLRATLRLVLRLGRILLGPRPRGIYLTVGQTPAGLLRDCVVLAMASTRKVPTLAHLHGGGLRHAYERTPNVVKPFVRSILARASAIVLLSSQLMDQVAFLERAPRVYIVPNWHPTNALRSPSARAKWEFAAPRTVEILFLGHVLPSKGLLDLLDAAMALVARGVTNFRITFAGAIIPEPGWPQNRIEAVLAEHQCVLGPAHFAVLGIVDGDAKWRLLNAAHILALPTRFPLEGQPISILEAMYAECAVLTTAYRGIVDLVSHGVNGWCVPSADPGALADVLSLACRNPNAIRPLAEAGRARCEGHFSPGRNLARLLDVMRITFVRPAQPYVNGN